MQRLLCLKNSRPFKKQFPTKAAPMERRWNPDRASADPPYCVEKYNVKLDLCQLSLIISETRYYITINRAILLFRAFLDAVPLGLGGRRRRSIGAVLGGN